MKLVMRDTACRLVAGAAALAVCSVGFGQNEAKGGLAESFLLPRNPGTGQIEWIGAGIIWLLVVLSVVSIGWLVVMAWSNRRREIVPDALWEQFDELVRARKFQSVYDLARKDHSDMARILRVALAESTHGYSAMIRAAEQSCEQLAVARLRRIEPLNIIGSVSPMIGLFGTVYGMIVAFREIVAAGGTPDPVALAAGIGTALTTTFWGLVVAIPALSGYAFIRNRIDGLTVEAAAVAEHIIGTLRPNPNQTTLAQPSGPKRGKARAEQSA